MSIRTDPACTQQTRVAATAYPRGRTPRSLGRGLLGCGAVCFAAACGGGDKPTGPGGSTGSLVVVTAATGADLDPDGFMLALTGWPGQAVPANGATLVAGLPAGTYQMQLTGVAGNCGLQGSPPASVTVRAAAVDTVRFAVACRGLEKIAFVSNRDGQLRIYLMNPDGTGVQKLTDAGVDQMPSWSPDGKRLAFYSSIDGGGIYLMQADGSGVTRLTTDPTDNSPAWSPDGGTIAVVRVQNARSQIFLVSADGSTVRQLTTGSDDEHPAWAPDGQRLAFERNYHIYVINRDGTGLTQVTSGPAVEAWPAWSPDGTRIAFTNNMDFGRRQIFVANVTGTAIAELTFTLVDASRPTWSRDGQRIAFAGTLQGGATTLQLFVISAQGGDLTSLTTGAAANLWPAWRP